MPSWITLSSVPQETFFSETEVIISPCKLGSSNLSVYFKNSFGFSSRYVPPNECPLPVEKLMNDILYDPPTFTSILWTVQTNPYGGIQDASASDCVNALYTFSGGAFRTLCNVTVPFSI